jgi:hypothetical protein
MVANSCLHFVHALRFLHSADFTGNRLVNLVEEISKQLSCGLMIPGQF